MITPEEKPETAPQYEGVVGGSVQSSAGWSAPSGDFLALMPELSVPRGGMKYPSAEEAAQRRLEQDAMRARQADRADRMKRHKELMSTVRVLGVLGLLALVLLGMLDALPWQ